SVTRGESRLPEIDSVPYLDVVAALNDSGTALTLFCVNRDLSRDFRAQIGLAGFQPKQNAVVHSLHAENIYQKNDETQPERVAPREESLPVGADGLSYDFRHASVTVIELHR